MSQYSQSSRPAPTRKPRGAPPGAGLSLAIAAVSGIVCWFWLASVRGNPAQSPPPNVSSLTEVEPGDIEGALTTLSLPAAALAQFREAKNSACRRPLAWVSLATPPGEPPSRIRLISGTYYSPVFDLSATPIRVALPYPAPYESGHGTLSAIEVGGTATIALLPPWHVSAQDGRTTRAVTWQPARNCPPSNG